VNPAGRWLDLRLKTIDMKHFTLLEVVVQEALNSSGTGPRDRITSATLNVTFRSPECNCPIIPSNSCYLLQIIFLPGYNILASRDVFCAVEKVSFCVPLYPSVRTDVSKLALDCP
jgi:hypothetical protein